jgi:hypothetical protein
MARWRKRESLPRALGRESSRIAKGVGKELLSIATLGLFLPSRRTFRYPKPNGSKRR